MGLRHNGSELRDGIVKFVLSEHEILVDYARSRRQSSAATDVLLRWTTRWQRPRSKISMGLRWMTR
jgi:hypothetical protein